MTRSWKPKSWLLFIYKVPSEPAKKRTFIWRKLNRMYALYLQQAVCLLPDTEINDDLLKTLSQRVVEFEGEATTLRVFSLSKEWESEIELRFESGREAKYDKLQEEIEKFIEEIDFEEYRKRFTIEELEELEEKLESIRRWFNRLKLEERKSSAAARETNMKISQASDRLDQFAVKVQRFEKPHERLKNKKNSLKKRGRS